MRLEYSRGQIDSAPGWQWFRDTYGKPIDRTKYNVTLYTCDPIDWRLHDAPYNPHMFHHDGFVLASCGIRHIDFMEYAAVIVSNAERLLIARASVTPGQIVQVSYGVCYTVAAVGSFPPFQPCVLNRLGLLAPDL